MDQSLTADLQRRLHLAFIRGSDRRSIGEAGRMSLASTVGPYRSDNEDRVAVARIGYPNGVTARVAVICDGMGGLRDGGGAAAEAISAFLASLAFAPNLPVPMVMQDALQRANAAVYQRYKGDGGTTLTSIFVLRSEAWAAHVGDSRLYAFGDQDGLELLSRDDTLQGALHAHQGGGDEDELDNRLLQYIGMGEALSPHVFPLTTNRHSLWIITSDGAHGIGRKAIGEIAKTSQGPSDVVRKLIYVAEALGTRDNASAVCVDAKFAADGVEPSVGWTTLAVWSPSQNFEIWLHGEVSHQVNGEQHQSRDAVQRPSDSKHTNRGRKRRGSGPSRDTKASTRRKDSISEDAQMQVLFGDDAPADD